jgi:hypothetical protein
MESKQSDENEAAREEVEGTKPYQSLVLFIAGVSNRLSILLLQPGLSPNSPSCRRTSFTSPALLPTGLSPYVTSPPLLLIFHPIPRGDVDVDGAAASEAGWAAGSHTLAGRAIAHRRGWIKCRSSGDKNESGRRLFASHLVFLGQWCLACSCNPFPFPDVVFRRLFLVLVLVRGHGAPRRPAAAALRSVRCIM